MPNLNSKKEVIKTSDSILSNLERQRKKPNNLNMFEALDQKNDGQIKINAKEQIVIMPAYRNPFLVGSNESKKRPQN